MFKRIGIIVVPIFFMFIFVLFLFGGSIGMGGSSGGSPPELNTEQEKNAWEIWQFFKSKNWSEEAIAGMLGNIQSESGIIADRHEESGGGGYGLTQWTPMSKLVDWCKEKGLDYKTIKAQCERIQWEMENNAQWFPNGSRPDLTFLSFKEFTELKDITKAAESFIAFYEHPKHPNQPARAQQAKYWYDKFHGFNGGGSSSGESSNTDIIKIALKELGNEGGQKFWSWYGYPSRVEWCATFVSWAGNQAGLNFEKFAYCPTGINNFKARNKWAEKGSTPKEGYIIFFDWESDGTSDHVGLVVKSEGGYVYTVEGNSNDAVREQKYTIDSSVICGYGIP